MVKLLGGVVDEALVRRCTEASYLSLSAAELCVFHGAASADDVRAWGLHLTHGALYTKKQFSPKGILSTRQLVSLDDPSLEDTPEMDEDAAADIAHQRATQQPAPAVEAE